MCDMCDNPDLTMADLRAANVRRIDANGWMIQYVFGEPGLPPFAYTVGLTAKDLPEAYVEGLNPNQAGELLNEVARSLLAGGIEPTEVISGPDGRTYLTAEGDTEQLEMYTAFEFYGVEAVRALKLTPN